MKIKDVLKFEKENMPDFQWKYEKFLFLFLLVWLGGAILTAIIALIIGFVCGENSLWFIPIIIWAIALSITLVFYVIKSKNVKVKLYTYHIKNLLHDYYTIDYLQAKQNLLDEHFISENGFISDSNEPFEEITIPFDKAKIYFNACFWGGKLFLKIILNDDDQVIICDLNNNYYNYLMKHAYLIQNKKLFQLFCEDKEKFVKLLMRYNNAIKIEKKL